MAEDQKERYIQYLAEQNQDLRLTSDAMKLVLEDFMAQMKDLKSQVSSMESKHADLENRLSEEHKLRKSAERKIKSLQERLDYAHQERFGDRRHASYCSPAMELEIVAVLVQSLIEDGSTPVARSHIA